MAYRSIYSFLWSVIKPFRWFYGAMMLAPVLSAFYDFGNNYALKLVVDAFGDDKQVSYQTLLVPIAIFIAAQMLIDIVWRAADIAEWKSEPFVRQAILNEVFWYVTHHPFYFFQNTPSGTITSRIKGILDGYDNFWAAMHHDFSPRIASVVVLISVLAIVNIKICIMVGFWAIFFVLIMYKFSLTLDKLSFQNAHDRHAILGLIADNVANILTVFSFATRKQELKRLNSEIENNFIPSNIKVYKYSFWSNVLAGLMYWIMLVSLFLYMIHLRITEQTTTGDVVFVMGITLKMSFELWQMVQRLQNFIKNIGDFKNAFTIMQMPHEEADRPDFPKLTVKNPSIEFRNLSFAYDARRPVFEHLNIAIKPREKVGLVGVSGSGKSTLVALLLKYFYPQAGNIFIDNQDIAHYSADSIRENIAVIPQDIVLFHRSIKENILYGRLEASDEEVIQAARLANIHDFIVGLPEGYDAMVGERGVKLSGGQRQRIAIARAILKRAKIIILDEATSSLDTETEKLIQSSLDQVLSGNNITVVAIAHRLSTIKHMDRIIVLQKGRIVEEGSHDELISNGKLYKKLWEMQHI